MVLRLPGAVAATPPGASRVIRLHFQADGGASGDGPSDDGPSNPGAATYRLAGLPVAADSRPSVLEPFFDGLGAALDEPPAPSGGELPRLVWL